MWGTKVLCSVSRGGYRLYALILCLLPLVAKADAGFLAVGLDEKSQQWTLYLQPEGSEWQAIETDDEPRTPDYNALQKTTAYADSQGNIRMIKDGVDSIVFAAGDTYTLTQPVFTEQGDAVYMVALKNGNSLDTDIVRGELSSGEIQSVVGQRSAQFEPFVVDDEIYYSSVSCVPPSCHRIIEDIWKINPVSRVAEQLTRFNAISREPVVHDSNIYFISDLSGQFRLHTLVDGKSVPLTSAKGIDSSPGVAENGDVVFIQKNRSSPDVLKIWFKATGEIAEIAGPPGTVKLRDFGVW